MPALHVEVVNGDVHRALSRFKRLVARDGILAETRGRKAFRSPGEKKRRKRKRAQMRAARAVLREAGETPHRGGRPAYVSALRGARNG